MRTSSKVTRCVVDCETTGLDRNQHDIIQLAILPVSDTLVPIKTPFDIRIKALTPETACPAALSINNLNPKDGLTLEESRNEFFKWRTLNGIDLIGPIAHNYIFDFLFIEKWLKACNLMYKDYFYYVIKDTFILANCANDARRLRNQKPLFKNTSLGSLCDELNINYESSHDALTDCKLTLEVYKRLLMIA